MSGYLRVLSQAGQRFRKKRFELFLRLTKDFGDRALRILDVGGTEAFWISMDFHRTKHTFTCLNVESWTKPPQNSNFSCVVGDARDMKEFAKGDFDIIFSNSVIEHVGHYNDQEAMAREVQRISDCYFIQTPNYYFPFEPHFHVPAFQMLPLTVRTKLIQRFALGCMPRVSDEKEARHLAETTRLIKRHELADLFPGAQIMDEKLGPLTKSLIAYKRRAA